MAQMNATQTLAEALSAAQRREADARTDPLIERLANALALPQPPEPTDYDDGDEDLDLPMLVQGNRFGAVVPMQPITHRRREGRAALVGFGLGLILLVPIGVVMSNRLPEPATVKADTSATALFQAAVPATVITGEVGIRTTKRATETISVPSAAVIEEPASKPVAPVPETKTAVAVPPPAPAPVAAQRPAPVAPAVPPPDHLADALALINQGDIGGARDRIQAADPDANPLALLALAETFDPNMLAAWSIRGAHADVDRARLLYQRALSHGVTKARQRLEALE